jgi:cold shock CspA family protein
VEGRGEPPPQGEKLKGVITTLVKPKRFGFIWVPGTPADMEYFFHESGVRDDYDVLGPGDAVSFKAVPGKVEADGTQRLKATGVEKIDGA